MIYQLTQTRLDQVLLGQVSLSINNSTFLIDSHLNFIWPYNLFLVVSTKLSHLTLTTLSNMCQVRLDQVLLDYVRLGQVSLSTNNSTLIGLPMNFVWPYDLLLVVSMKLSHLIWTILCNMDMRLTTGQMVKTFKMNKEMLSKYKHAFQVNKDSYFVLKSCNCITVLAKNVS